MAPRVKEGKPVLSEWIDAYGVGDLFWPMRYNAKGCEKFGRRDTTYAYIGYVQGVGVHLFYDWEAERYHIFTRSDKPPVGWCLRRGRFWYSHCIDVPGVSNFHNHLWALRKAS